MNLSREKFERLALAELDTLHRVARRLTRNAAAAEDLVQETYLRAMRGAEKFHLEEFGIRPWLLRIMANLSISRSEREQRQPQRLDDLQLGEAADSAHAADVSSRSALFDSLDEQLAAALEDLPVDYQQVLVLWAVEDLTYKEIAEVMNIPIGTVMSRLHRARERLSSQLRDYAEREGVIRE